MIAGGRGKDHERGGFTRSSRSRPEVVQLNQKHGGGIVRA